MLWFQFIDGFQFIGGWRILRFPTRFSFRFQSGIEFWVESEYVARRVVHHKPSQITCQLTSLAEPLFHDQLLVLITGQILADSLSLSHPLSHFYSVFLTQTTSPL